MPEPTVPRPVELLPQHLDQLAQGSGIAPEVIAASGYRSIVPPEGYGELKRLGFSDVHAKRSLGLLIPILGWDGQPVLYQFRPDSPRHDGKGRPIKYNGPRKLDQGISKLWGMEGLNREA